MSDSSDSAPSEGGEAAASSPTGDSSGTPSQGQPSPAEADLFELDGQKLSPAELRKQWSGIVGNYSKGKNAAQLMTKADQVRREAEQKARQAEEFWEVAQKDPRLLRGFFAKRGLDPDNLASHMLMETIQKEQMSEGERRLFEAQKQLEEREGRIKQWEQQQRHAAEERAVATERERYKKMMDEAVGKLGLPKESSFVATRRIAAIMEKALDADVELSVEEAAGMARDEFSGELRSLVASLEGPALVQFLGDEVVKRLRAHDLAQLKSRRPGMTPVAPQANPNLAGRNGSTGRQKPLTESERDKILTERIRAMEQT